jgi:hypothetical protein
MQDSAIRHLAITDESSIVAAALFKKTVQIWSWSAKRVGVRGQASNSASFRRCWILAGEGWPLIP